MIAAIGPNTIFVQRFGITSFAGGAEFKELIKRPNLSISDARALEQQADTIQFVDIELGAGGPPTQRRVFYGTQKTKGLVVFGTSEYFAEGTRIPMLGGRFFNGTELQYRKNVAVIGNTAVPAAVRAERHRPGRQDRADWQPSGSKWSASSTSGPPPAASTSGRTTSSSSPTPRTSASSASTRCA